MFGSYIDKRQTQGFLKEGGYCQESNLKEMSIKLCVCNTCASCILTYHLKGYFVPV